ncbi:MAG TPA: hypothetical protein VMB24_02300 [Dehalococcoidales bacterium]|nr:hypothetical protein [Dehalococcoidales bacterium]
MIAASKEMKQLVGEHEALMAYMKTLTRSAENLVGPSGAKERLWNYRYCLHDFQDAIAYHLDIDDRVFRAILGSNYLEDSAEEHREIRQLLNDTVIMADCAVIDTLGQDEMTAFCDRLGQAFKKIVKLLEVHIARENAILERVQQSLN